MSYTVGNLELNIQTFSNDSAKNLDKVIAKLDFIKKSLEQLTGGFTTLSSAVKGVTNKDLKWITSLGTRLNNLTKKDMSGAVAIFTNLTKAITPFIEKITGAREELIAFNSILSKTSNLSEDAQKAIDKAKGKKKGKKSDESTSFLGQFGKVFNKLYYIRNITRQLAQRVEGLVQNAIDYNETLNLWQVAMRNNLSSADQFIKKMTRATGISTQVLMNYQATFKNMLSALGDISNEGSYMLSETLTQMALDFSSLYNTTIERAMTVFQSVLSGQVRPIRSISGYDITENTIYQVYQSLGGTKTMRALSQTEKRLLRIYAVYHQMSESGTIGDLAKTIEQPANQLRIAAEQLKEAGMWIGQVFLLALKNFLPKFNAVIIVAKEVFKSIAYTMGYQDEDFLSGFVETTEEANSAVDELTGKLLSFDRFEALNSSENNVLGIDSTILNALASYESNLNNIIMEAQRLAEEWLTVLGFQYDSEKQLWKMGEGAKALGEVLKYAAIFLGVLAGKGIIHGLGTVISKITGITKGVQLLNVALAASAIYGIITFIEGIQEGDFGKIILGFIVTALSLGTLVTNNLQKISQILIGIQLKITNIQREQRKAALGMMNYGNGVKAASSYMGLLVASAAVLAGSLWAVFSNENLSAGEKMASVFLGIAAAVVAATIALKMLQGNWVAALSIAATVASGVMLVSSALMGATKTYANGGYIPRKPGTLAMVGENGRTELMANLHSGGTAVANIDQIEEAQYRAFTRFARDNKGYFKSDYSNITIEMDRQKVGQLVAKPSYSEMRRTNIMRK